MELRPHQQQAYRSVFTSLKSGSSRHLVVLPTGAGKTVVICHVIKKHGGRALVLAHRDELLTQIYETVRKVIPRASVGFVKAGVDESDRDVVIASVQSLSRLGRLTMLAKDFRTIVIDEAHHALAPTYQRIIGHFSKSSPLILGVTATPFRAGNKGMNEVFYTIFDKIGIEEGIRDGWLSDIEGKLICLKNADFGSLHVKKGDYDLSELEAIMRAANWHEYVGRAYYEHARSRKTLIFVSSVAMAHQLADHIRATGNAKIEAVDGAMSMERRRDIVARLASGRLDAVVNCSVFTEGFDDPSISCIVMARPTRSRGLYIQCIGRGLRALKGKSDCLVLDIVGATQRHDLVGLATLANVRMMGNGERFSAALERGEIEAEKQRRLEAETEARRVELLRKRETPKPPCVRCDSLKVYRYGSRNGEGLLKCKSCGCFFTPNGKRHARKHSVVMPPCIHCGSSSTRRHRIYKDGRNGVMCKNCGKTFVQELVVSRN